MQIIAVIRVSLAKFSRCPQITVEKKIICFGSFPSSELFGDTQPFSTDQFRHVWAEKLYKLWINCLKKHSSLLNETLKEVAYISGIHSVNLLKSIVLYIHTVYSIISPIKIFRDRCLCVWFFFSQCVANTVLLNGWTSFTIQ